MEDLLGACFCCSQRKTAPKVDAVEVMKRERDGLCPSEPLAARQYVLLVSGTMNPPHVGHVRLGLAAAARLRASGHIVKAICYVPVHDNYLCNKVIDKRQGGKSLSVLDAIAFPMSERCALLKELIAGEPAEQTRDCHVLDYEHSSGDAGLLATSPGYWAPKLPGGYLKTVPTASVISSFAANSPLMSGGARLGVVFGVDNLAGMATWNNPRGLLAQADLVLLARAMPAIKFGKDPTELLGALRHVEIEAAVPVVHGDETLLGSERGSFTNAGTCGEGALFMLPPLEGDDEGLSSTRIRKAVAAKLGASTDGGAGSGSGSGGALSPDDVLAAHGYPASSQERLLAVVKQGEKAVEKMVATGKAQSEWVVP